MFLTYAEARHAGRLSMARRGTREKQDVITHRCPSCLAFHWKRKEPMKGTQ